jgi:hypothetical protein
VPQVVKAHGTEPGAAGCGLEAFAHLRGVKHASAGRVAEDEISFVAEGCSLEVLPQRGGYSLGKRDGAIGAPRLRRSELAARVGAADADHSRVVIDVLPAQGKHLAPT